MAAILWTLATLTWCVLGSEERPVTPDGPVWYYNEDVSRSFAAMAQASYCGPDVHLMNWTCKPCRTAGVEVVPGSVRFIQRREIYQSNSTFILLARLASMPKVANFTGGCLVSFRGSSTTTNWIRDFQFWNKPVRTPWCKGCYVEDGFNTILRNVEDQLISELADIGCTPQKKALELNSTSSLYITGHSLGAAVGTLAMLRFGGLGFNIRLSHLFESPRVGNEQFAAVFDKEFSRTIPMFRITHARDPVPHLPPRDSIVSRYRHVNYEVFYARNGSWRFCAFEEDPVCADRYSLVGTLPHTADHCASPLVLGGDICECPDHDEELLV